MAYKINVPITTGWMNIRVVTGTLAGYTAGGMAIDFGECTPSAVIGVQASKGHVGFFDISSKKFKAYQPSGDEATSDGTVEFSVTVMI